MGNEAKIFTVIEFILSAILWLLALLTLAFNILGLWAPWHLAGFGFLFFLFFPPVPLLLSLVFSARDREWRMLLSNLLSLVVSVGFTLLTFFVSSTWFW